MARDGLRASGERRKGSRVCGAGAGEEDLGFRYVGSEFWGSSEVDTAGGPVDLGIRGEA